MSNIRIATIEDLELICEMANKFINATAYAKLADQDPIRALASKILTSDGTNSIILIADKAMIAGAAVPFIFGTQLIATEIAWWVDPELRKTKIGSELLSAFEFWAKKVGCTLITMVSLDDDLGKYYEKKGYRLYERAYMKEI